MSKEEKPVNSVFADKLAGLKLDFKTYGQLPIREDVYLIEQPNPEDNKNKVLLGQWEKLKNLQKHLNIFDTYIRTNKGESVDLWLIANDKHISDKVLTKLTGHNNATGGISAWFYNLQVHYDEQEALYDKMEAESKIPADFKKALDAMREERGEKRTNRGAERKILVKDLKKNGQGYLEVAIEEEPTVEETETKQKTEKVTEQSNKVVQEQTEKIKKTTKNIEIWIAGTVIAILAIGVLANTGAKAET